MYIYCGNRVVYSMWKLQCGNSFHGNDITTSSGFSMNFKLFCLLECIYNFRAVISTMLNHFFTLVKVQNCQTSLTFSTKCNNTVFIVYSTMRNLNRVSALFSLGSFYLYIKLNNNSNQMTTIDDYSLTTVRRLATCFWCFVYLG